MALLLLAPKPIAASSLPPRAVVLEPFAEQLGLGVNAGQREANTLRSAGFSVDILRDHAVTVRWMQRNLAAYTLIYINTHAGELPNGDLGLATGERNIRRYGRMRRDLSLVQIRVTDDKGGPRHYYDAITGRFVRHFVKRFQPHSLVYVDSCYGLDMPLLWAALHYQGVSTLIGWHGRVGVGLGEEAAQLIFTELAAGKSIKESISDARIAGVGKSWFQQRPGTLSYAGLGNTSLADLRSSASERG